MKFHASNYIIAVIVLTTATAVASTRFISELDNFEADHLTGYRRLLAPHCLKFNATCDKAVTADSLKCCANRNLVCVETEGKSTCRCNPDPKLHLQACNRKCVDTRTYYKTSKSNCGWCGHKCSFGNKCIDGKCLPSQEPTEITCGDGSACAETEHCCWGLCKNLQTDVRHCGGCGVICLDTETCTAGKCVKKPVVLDNTPKCAANEILCGDSCILSYMLLLDSHNCGECGHVCDEGANEVCEDGECVLYRECTRNSDCTSSKKPICDYYECVACDSNEDCSALDATKPYCMVDGSCSAPPPECTKDSDCKSSTKPFCKDSSCAGCSSSSQCAAANPAKPYCRQDGKCSSMLCDTDSDCIEAAKPICKESGCASCNTNDQCFARNPSKPYCHSDGSCSAVDPYVAKVCLSDTECDNENGHPYCVGGFCAGCGGSDADNWCEVEIDYPRCVSPVSGKCAECRIDYHCLNKGSSCYACNPDTNMCYIKSDGESCAHGHGTCSDGQCIGTACPTCGDCQICNADYNLCDPYMGSTIRSCSNTNTKSGTCLIGKCKCDPAHTGVNSDCNTGYVCKFDTLALVYLCS